jgi:hypothetical protein
MHIWFVYFYAALLREQKIQSFYLFAWNHKLVLKTLLETRIIISVLASLSISSSVHITMDAGKIRVNVPYIGGFPYDISGPKAGS